MAESAELGKTAEIVMAQEKFINLFTKGKHDVSEPATAYIAACCEDSDKAIQLLRDNGFRVSIVSAPAEVERMNRIYDQSRESWPTEQQVEFDGFASGVRGPVLWRFWDILSSYEVSLFIKDDKVIKVSARVVRTFP